MSQKRRKFSPQFKAEAVQFVIETGRPINEIAKELEIHEGTLGHWVKQWKDENPEPETALTPMERVRVAEMEAEMRRLRMENEFLKKSGGELILSKQTVILERRSQNLVSRDSFDLISRVHKRTVK